MIAKFLDGPFAGTLAEFPADETFLKVFADQEMQDIYCCYQCIGIVFDSGIKLFRMIGEAKDEHAIAWSIPPSRIEQSERWKPSPFDKRLLHQCKISSE